MREWLLQQPGNFVNFFSKIHNGVVLNLLIQAFSTFGLGFAAYYFKVQGVEFYKIILIWAIGPLVSLPVVVFSSNWNIKRFLRLGLLTYTGMSFSLFFFNQYSFILYGIFTGLNLALVWDSLNHVFFLNSTRGNHARNSSIYFILGPLIGIILPPICALIIDGWGFRMLFLITGLLSFIPLFYVRGEVFEHTIKMNWRDINKNFSGLRLITFYDGALHYFQSNFLIVYALLFLTTEYQVGGLLSYMAFISLAASFVLAHISDKSQKRTGLLYPLLIIMSCIMLVIPAIKSLAFFVIAAGLYAAFDNISLPLRFAIRMDYTTPDIGFWRASEFYGNIGRTCVFGVAALLLYLGNKWVPFAIFAVLAFTFPFVINQKIKGLRKQPVP
jgi:hypothetical protein